jgi:hypothetical protein
MSIAPTSGTNGTYRKKAPVAAIQINAIKSSSSRLTSSLKHLKGHDVEIVILSFVLVLSNDRHAQRR